MAGKRATGDGAGAVRRQANGGRPQIVAARRNMVMTRKKQEAFLAELAATCNASASARAVGLLEGTVFMYRTRNAAFRAAWAEALEQGYSRLELALLERAINGTEKVVVATGETVREFDHRMALRLMEINQKAVLAQRVRTEAEAGVPQPEDDPVARLIARLDEMAERMNGEGA